MHQPRPYGLHTIGQKLTSNDQAFIHSTAKRFSNLKEVSELENMRMVYDLPDGGYIVVQDMGGNFRIVAHKPKNHEFIIRDGLATDYIPMLYSGVVLNATPFSSDGTPIKLTEVTRRRLVDYDPNKPKPEKTLELHRFRIEYDFKFQYFKPALTGVRTFTQYHKLRATWYSGAMSEVVQVVAGYGRLDFGELPDDKFERKSMLLPKKVHDEVRKHVIGQRLPAYDGITDMNGQHKYDYRHGICNAVSFDTAGKPWLLRISPAGVYAMPLPIIPATTAPAFLDYLYEVDDHELIHVVERFGGLPSGENFLTGDDFQAWYRAGAIIKICDTTEFYKHSAFYMACGWAFNSQGTEAFNTCWSGGGTSMRYAHGFKMRLRLGSAKNNGWVADNKDLPIEDLSILARFMARVDIALNGNNHRERAIRYKIVNTPAAKLLPIARAEQVDINYWENLIADPIAIHSGNVSEVSKGNLYWGSSNPLSFGYLKFPEFTGQGCESFDMSMPEYKGVSARCDTVVFGCYVNDQLTVIKYFLDERTFHNDKESDFEDVMIIGDWEETETSGSSGLLGYLYTTNFDDRREASDTVKFTQVSGRDLGYGNPAYSTPPLLYMWGSLSRHRYYSYLTKVTFTYGDNMSVAVCVPTLTRDSMLHAYSERTESKSYREEMQRRSVVDPTTYDIWTYDPIFHYMGSNDRARGAPRPKTGDYAYAVYDYHTNYRPTKYSWFSDSGNWHQVPDGSYKDESSTVTPYTIRGSDHNANGVVVGGEAPLLETYIKTDNTNSETKGRVSVAIQVRGSGEINKNIPSAFYYDFSPADAGGSLVYFYRDATWITCGTQKYSNVSETKDLEGRQRAHYGNTSLADHKSAHCFIGVINE